MDDLSATINSVLSDPEQFSNLKSMAEMLFSDQEKTQESVDNDFDIGKIMSVVNRIKNSSSGENEKLLLALKPHLSEKRQQRVDTAVKILKLLEFAPLLSSSGLLDLGGIL